MAVQQDASAINFSTTPSNHLFCSGVLYAIQKIRDALPNGPDPDKVEDTMDTLEARIIKGFDAFFTHITEGQ